MLKFNILIEENKIPRSKEDINKVLAELFDFRFQFDCKNLSTLKDVFQDMYIYSTDLYLYSQRMHDTLMDEDYSVEKKTIIHEKFQHILEMLDGYRMEYKSRSSNLD